MTEEAAVAAPPVKLTSLKSSFQKEADGEWVESLEYPGVSWNVRSNHYPAYQAAVAAMTRRLSKQYGSSPIPETVAGREGGILVARHLLLGWKGLDVEYSDEIAMSTLSDPEHRGVRADVLWASTKVAKANAEYVEEASGN